MDKQEVIELMRSSESEQEWDRNCDTVKREFGGYPPFWYEAIVLSGVLSQTAAKWSGDADIRVETRSM